MTLTVSVQLQNVCPLFFFFFKDQDLPLTLICATEYTVSRTLRIIMEDTHVHQTDTSSPSLLLRAILRVHHNNSIFIPSLRNGYSEVTQGLHRAYIAGFSALSPRGDRASTYGSPEASTLDLAYQTALNLKMFYRLPRSRRVAVG